MRQYIFRQEVLGQEVSRSNYYEHCHPLGRRGHRPKLARLRYPFDITTPHCSPGVPT